MTIKILVLKGVPASGKSTFCRDLMKKEPGQWKRINNDSLREAIDFSVFSTENETMIRNLRNHMLREFVKHGHNVLIDNVNASKRNWNEIVKIASEANRDIFLTEKPFYIDLEEAIVKDALREGNAKVGKEVITKLWKQLGGKQFSFSKPKIEVFKKRTTPLDKNWVQAIQDESLPRCVIFDNDGTVALPNGRNPYDASTCDQDLPHPHVIECLKLYAKAGYKIIFVSGRQEKDTDPTIKFYQKYFPEIEYELFMRTTGDMRKDVVIKEEIFEKHIKNQYYVAGWFDDRLQVCRWIYENGLPLFRVNDPEACF